MRHRPITSASTILFAAIAAATLIASPAAARSADEIPTHHPMRHDIIVFGDPFWDPLWDLDTGLTLGYVPYAYPPRAWASLGPTKAERRNFVPIALHVHPWKASVIVDGSALGQARDYNDDSHPLFLVPGSHLVELQYPGYETLRFDLDVQKGLPRDLHYTMIKGVGVDPRSAEAPRRDEAGRTASNTPERNPG